MPKIVDHDQKRHELLVASFELFARRGYASVTMRELAKELDVSTGTLYHYFPNKQQLFAQMFEAMTQQDVTRVGAKFDVESPTQSKLKVLFQFLSDNESHFQNLLMMGFDYHRHHKESAGDTLHAALAHYRSALEEQLRLGEGLGGPMLSFLIGMVAQRLMDSPSTDYAAHQRLLEMFIPLTQL